MIPSEMRPGIDYCSDKGFCGKATPNTERLITESSGIFDIADPSLINQQTYQELFNKGLIKIGENSHAQLTPSGLRELNICLIM